MLGFLKLVGVPGSIEFFCLLAGIGLLVRWWQPAAGWIVWRALLALAVGYLILSLPLVAAAIADRLPPVPRALPPESPGTVDELVILDGDNRRGRVRAGITVNAVAAPREIWVLGNGWLIEELSKGGVPRNRIFHDAFLTTTREQLTSLRALVARRPGRRFAVIVSRLQASRMAGLLAAASLTDVALIPSPVDDEPATSGLRTVVPTYLALRLSRDAIYEHAAIRFYRWKGWIP